MAAGGVAFAHVGVSRLVANPGQFGRTRKTVRLGRRSTVKAPLTCGYVASPSGLVRLPPYGTEVVPQQDPQQSGSDAGARSRPQCSVDDQYVAFRGPLCPPPCRRHGVHRRHAEHHAGNVRTITAPVVLIVNAAFMLIPSAAQHALSPGHCRWLLRPLRGRWRRRRARPRWIRR